RPAAGPVAGREEISRPADAGSGATPPCYERPMEPRAYLEHLKQQTEALQGQGLFKRERVIEGPQGAEIRVQGGREVLNFCANNYLGLGNHPRVVKAAQSALARHGYGMASVRFICGTQVVHRELEGKL